MLSWDLFRHYLLSRRAGAVVRSVAWLCIIGVGVGVTSLIVVLSVMNGFNDSIRTKLLAVEPHLVVTIPGISKAEDISSAAIFQTLKRRPELRVDVYETQDVLLRTSDGLYGGAIARGVDAEALAYILNESRKAGQAHRPTYPQDAMQSDAQIPPASPESSDLAPGEAIVGVDLARSLGLFEGDRAVAIAPEALLLPPGEAPPFERVIVKSLLTANVADIDGKMLYYARGKTLARLRDGASREVGFEVRLPDPTRFQDIKAQIEATGAKVATWQERNSSLFYALRLEKFAIGAVLAAASLIASLSIVTVLVLLLSQKRKDIGALMAMGLSARRTQQAFVGLGLMLGLLGMGGGVIAGLTICFIIDRYPLPILPEIYYDATIPSTVDPWLVVTVLASSVVIAGVSAWLPARAHARLQPADALRAREIGGN